MNQKVVGTCIDSPTERRRRRPQSKSWMSCGMAIFLGLLSSCLVVSFAIHRHVALTYGSEEGGSFALRAAAAPRGGKDTTAKTSIELPRGRRLLGTDKTSSQSQSSNQNKRDEGGESIIELVHVVHTRFMQSQPHLLALGRARRRCFEHSAYRRWSINPVKTFSG